MYKGFKNKGRRLGEEIEGIPLPVEYENEFKVKDVRFFYESMNYGYRPSRKSILLNSPISHPFRN